jgi:hypothetical protein
MNKEELLEYMKEEHEGVLSGILDLIKTGAKVGEGSVDVYMDTHHSLLTLTNQYYISHALSTMGYNVTLDQHLTKITVSWF